MSIYLPRILKNCKRFQLWPSAQHARAQERKKIGPKQILTAPGLKPTTTCMQG